jgi:hypothetical protein
MHFFDQIKTGGFADPSTLQGAFPFAVNSGVMLSLDQRHQCLYRRDEFSKARFSFVSPQKFS